MIAAPGKVLFYGILRCLYYFGDFLYRVAFHIEQEHRCALFGRKAVERGIQGLVAERGVGGR